ncbi:MAG: FtsQ-type POTRA domain-containing protein [Firmicutes bacterium]|nr:FtsQ-type POTRA domain-containing protein [Bacillota bacterium]
MALLRRNRALRPWLPWARVLLVAVLVAGAGWGVLELGQRYLGLQRLTIDQVLITGCKGERLAQVQKVADELCLGKPLFWFDAEKLRTSLEAHRWVKGLLIRRDPPDRLSLVIEERQPLLWVARATGVYLVADDGVVLDRVNQSNLLPIPVVADLKSQSQESLPSLIRMAATLRGQQKDFYERLSELRWSSRGPVVFLEGLPAPIYLSRQDPTKNIPDFQAIYLERYAKSPEGAQVRYFDLRWDGDVVAGDQALDAAPKTRSNEGASAEAKPAR